MTGTARQLLTGILLHIRQWLCTPKHIIISIALSIAFLILANRLMIIHVGPHMRVGIHTQDIHLARNVARHFSAYDVTSVHYRSLDDARHDLAQGHVIGVFSLPTNTTDGVHMLFSETNPLLDRELASVFLAVGAALSKDTDAYASLHMDAHSYTPDAMMTYMTAGLIPFLLFALASINGGIFWLGDIERGTLFTLLAMPVKRSVLLTARLIGSVLLILLTCIITILVCRLVVPWSFGPSLILWWSAVTLQILVMCGIFFALALLCRNYALYNDAGLILAFILMFLSGALAPVIGMPLWARMLSATTPTYYAVRMMRSIMCEIPGALVKDSLMLMVWGIIAYTYAYLRLCTLTIDRRT